MKKVLAFALTLPLAISACGGPDTPTPQVQPQAVQGTLQSGFVSGAAVNLFAGTSLLSTGPVSGNGSFTLALPSAAAIAPYLTASDASFAAVGNGCIGQVTDSAPGALAFGFTTLVSNGVAFDTTVVKVDASNTSATASGFLWFYSDRARTVSGSVTCRDASSSIAERYDASIQPGWNLMKLDGTFNGSGSMYTQSTVLSVVPDQATSWNVSSPPQAASTQSLKGVVTAKFRPERVLNLLLR